MFASREKNTITIGNTNINSNIACRFLEKLLKNLSHVPNQKAKYTNKIVSNKYKQNFMSWFNIEKDVMCGEFAEANVGGWNEAISLIDRKMSPKAFDSVGKHSNTETEIFDEKWFSLLKTFSAKDFFQFARYPGDGHHSCVVRRLLQQ